MNLRIIKPGVLDSLQDQGRYGWQQLGINPGGAMDRYAARVANVLVGNDPMEAVIEMHFPASTYFFEKPALIAVAGADFSASVNGEPVPCCAPVLVSKFSILQFHTVVHGARSYLAVHGGFALEPWLNSNSTHLKAGIGGFEGRSLQKDDDIPMRTEIDFSSRLQKKEFEILPWKTDMAAGEDAAGEIAVLPGHEWERLDEASRELFLRQEVVISHQSDRMGYGLRSGVLQTTTNEEMVSSAVNFGTVQLLPDGQMIVLMADHQTAGGYPRIAHVITAHHHRLAQLKPGDRFRFRMVDQTEAESLLIRQQQQLLQLQNACSFKIDELLHAH